MTLRNLESRLIKLEGSAGHAGKALLIWYRPKERTSAAIDKARHLFGPDDAVMLAPWYDADEPPSPAWYDEQFPRALDERARGFLYRWAEECSSEPKGRSKDALTTGRDRFEQFTDAQLWIVLLSVERSMRREVCH